MGSIQKGAKTHPYSRLPPDFDVLNCHENGNLNVLGDFVGELLLSEKLGQFSNMTGISDL